MKNLKVRTKLNLILTLVILLVVLASAVSINNMNQVKDKAVQETVKVPAYAAPLGIAAILVMTAVLLVRLFKK